MSKTLKCVVVDDEPPAIRLVESFINKIPSVELVYSTTKPLQAIAFAETHSFDLIFLDIQMPNLTGIQLSKILRKEIKVIFTTAYPEFAVESYQLNAADYLLKPFNFERFYQAVQKVSAGLSQPTSSLNEDYVFVKTDSKNSFEKVQISDILYIEGLRNYVAIHQSNKQVITYNTLKSIKERLPQEPFVQIHKSFIVAIAQIDKTTTHSVFIRGNDLPIGESFKSAFFQRIREKKL